MLRTVFGIFRTHFGPSPFMLRIGPFGPPKLCHASRCKHAYVDALHVSARMRKITFFSLFLASFENVRDNFRGCLDGCSNGFLLWR